MIGQGEESVMWGNSQEYLYINGDEITDGSRRISIDSDTAMAVIEKRIEGIWQAASLELGPNSLWIGKSVGIAGVGHHMATESTDEHLHFHAHGEFDGEVSVEDAQLLYAYNFVERVIYQADNSGSWTGTNFEYSFLTPFSTLIKAGYFQTHTTAATEVVRIRIWKGEDDTGALTFDQKFPASAFPASSEAHILFEGYQEFDEGIYYFTRMNSDADFSLKMNAAETIPWQAADVSNIREDNLLQTKPWVSGDSWTSGDYFIDSRKIYICNSTGVQTGTFASNSALWDELGDEVDDIWTREEGVISPTNSGDDILTTGDIYGAEGRFTGTLNLSSSVLPSIATSGNRLSINETSGTPQNDPGMVTQFSSGAYSPMIFAITDTAVNTAFFGLDGTEFTIGSEGDTSIRFKKSMAYNALDILGSGTDMLVMDGATSNITTAGYVGVGIEPSHPLHVLGSINQLVLRVQANVMNSDNWHGIGFSGENQNTKGGILWQSNNTQYSRGSIVFAINSESNQNNVTISDERMRITEGGHVGIGNNNPIADLDMLHTDNAPMHVQLAVPGTGNAQEVALDLVSKTDPGYVLGDTANSKGWKFLVVGDAFSDAAKQNDFGLIHWDGSTWADRIWIEHSDGHVGLGTTTPAARLDIIDTSDSQLRLSYDTEAFHSFNVSSDGSMAWTPRGTNADISIDFTSATDGDFFINENDFYVDTSAGRVGIGTATPQALLDVNGDLLVDDYTLFVDAVTHKVGIGTTNPGAELDVHGLFRNIGTAALQTVTVETNLTLGVTASFISHAPTWTFTVDTDIVLSGNVDSLNFDENTLSIDSLNNRVGVGNNAPTTALDVTGTITADLHAGTAVAVTGDITTDASLYQPVFGDQTGQVLSLTFSEFAASIQYDESRKDNDCVMTGGTVTASNGKYGSGLSLNGTTDFGTITTPVGFPSSNNVRTFEALVYADSVGPGNFTIFSYGQHLGTNIFAVERTLTSLRVFTLGDSVSSASGVFSADTWHLVQVTYNGTHIDAWMDGVQVITNQALTVTTTAGTDAYVGRDVNNSSFWNGDIDFIRMYDRVLAEDELRTHYLRTTGGSVVRSESFKVVNSDDVVTLEAGQVGTDVLSLYQHVYGDDTGLILDLPFKEIGGTTQYDRSPTGSEANIIDGASVTTTGGPFGSGMVLDGTNDYVVLPDIPDSFAGGLTLEIWAYPTAAQNWARFYDIGNGESDNNILFGRFAETDDIAVQVFAASVGGTNVIASDAIELYEWQHFIATITTAGFVSIYKDGELLTTGTTSAMNSVTRTSNFIGKSNWSADDHYQGNLSNAKIYRRILSPVEIKAYYLRGNNTDSMSVIKSDKAQVVDTSNNAYDISLNPSNVIEIRTAADLAAQAVGGVITVDSAKTFVIKSQIVTDIVFVVNSGAVFGINFENSGSIVYTDSGTLFSGSGGRLFVTNGMLIASGGGTLFNHIGQVGVGWAFKSLNIIGFAGGSLDFPIISLENVNLIFPADTLTITECAGFKALNFNLGLASAFNKPVFDIISTGYYGAAINVNTAAMQFPGTGSFLKLGPAIGDNATILVAGVNIGSGELFANSGSTGTFTAVADASVGATAITSVTDSSGLARFNFTVGPTVYPYQEIVISGFTTNTAYNGTWIITSTGAGYFEVKRIAFGSDETGSFLSNSITLTDNGTSLSDGDSVTIDTIFTTDYDGGTWVYNKQTNSVQVNKTWVANETGYWDASGLDQRDPRVLANTNPGHVDSHYIANGYVNGNTTACGTIVNNTFTDMVFGPTPYNALIEGSSMERWKLLDDINGTFEYTGKEPFDGSITYGVSAQSTGAAIEFRYKWVHDVGAGFVDLPDVVEAANEIANATSATFSVTPLQAVKGDKIKPQITRSSGTSGITITHFQVNTQQ